MRLMHAEFVLQSQFVTLTHLLNASKMSYQKNWVILQIIVVTSKAGQGKDGEPGNWVTLG